MRKKTPPRIPINGQRRRLYFRLWKSLVSGLNERMASEICKKCEKSIMERRQKKKKTNQRTENRGGDFSSPLLTDTDCQRRREDGRRWSAEPQLLPFWLVWRHTGVNHTNTTACWRRKAAERVTFYWRSAPLGLTSSMSARTAQFRESSNSPKKMNTWNQRFKSQSEEVIKDVMRPGNKNVKQQ